MQEYDVVFKLLLQHFASRSWANILGAPIVKWLPIELPKFQYTRVDLLGELASGTLVQIDLQSTNDGQMALRMAEYCLGIYRQYRRFHARLWCMPARNQCGWSDVLQGQAFLSSAR